VHIAWDGFVVTVTATAATPMIIAVITITVIGYEMYIEHRTCKPWATLEIASPNLWKCKNMSSLSTSYHSLLHALDGTRPSGRQPRGSATLALMTGNKIGRGRKEGTYLRRHVSISNCTSRKALRCPTASPRSTRRRISQSFQGRRLTRACTKGASEISMKLQWKLQTRLRQLQTAFDLMLFIQWAFPSLSFSTNLYDTREIAGSLLLFRIGNT
jgi:hypothetical protein